MKGNEEMKIENCLGTPQASNHAGFVDSQSLYIFGLKPHLPFFRESAYESYYSGS